MADSISLGQVENMHHSQGLFYSFRRALHTTQSLRTRVAVASSGDIAQKLGQHVTNAGTVKRGFLFVSGTGTCSQASKKRCTGRRRLESTIMIVGRQMSVDKDRAYYG